MVIGLSVDELFGNIFLNNAVLGLADFVAMLGLVFVSKYFKRQILLSCSLLMMAITLLTSSILRGVNYSGTRKADLAFMLVAKFFSSSKLVCRFFPFY